MSRFGCALVLTLTLGLGMASRGAAQSACSSDGAPQPVRLLERFTSADCAQCWRDPQTPQPQSKELVLDWIVPGSLGADAPLAMGASRDALQRLHALKLKPSKQPTAVRSPLSTQDLELRAAQGPPVNDYIGASIELEPARSGPWRAWLLLVEAIPAGSEGSAVARNLVRQVFRPPWDEPRLQAHAPPRLYALQPMQIPEGAHAERLRVVALLEDSQGRLKALAYTVCGT